ncbi:MAG: hypothetical protein HXY30_00540 [Pseudorhodoplanes sp.]|nr:hypothetical protein [Pseudorhodoplanes sp.]
MKLYLELQMCRDGAAPRTIDYDACRVRAAAKRRQAKRAAARVMVRHARRAGLSATRSIVAAALLAAMLFAFGRADATPSSGSSTGDGMKPPSVAMAPSSIPPR